MFAAYGAYEKVKKHVKSDECMRKYDSSHAIRIYSENSQIFCAECYYLVHSDACEIACVLIFATDSKI